MVVAIYGGDVLEGVCSRILLRFHLDMQGDPDERWEALDC